MFKKFIYILTCAALLCSCVKEEVGGMFTDDQLGVEHNGKVTLGFNVDIVDGMPTKSMTETPDIQNIYVAVFDASGYKLSEYVKANPITTGPENDHKYQFTVELKISEKPRTLHFIANGPKELRFGTEQEVVGELFTKSNADESDEYSRKDAYWQRLVFSKISPRPEGTDDGSQAWQDYNSMVETLSNLKLIRNFSKVTLSKRTPVSEDSENFKNFQILGMWFVNYPDRGSVAPYNRNTGLFGTERLTYLDYDNMADVEDKTKGNYQGFTLASTEFITPSVFDSSNMIGAISNTASGYVYEREKALKSPMYLILKCRYSGAETYYKVAMQDEDGKFYAILRNFNYTVQVQDVTAAGYPSAQAALEGAPTGDISVNVDYQELPNISDGNARITVSATKIIIVGGVGYPTTASFWYKYEPDITVHGETGIHNDMATGVEATDKATPHVLITYDGTEGSTGAVIDNISVAGSNDGGNRYVTINTTNVSATPKIQTINIEGRRWDGIRYQAITRTIQLVLRNALEMTLSASPNTDSENAANVMAQKDQPVVLHIGIEQDLPASMFPLYFSIDPSVNSLTPDNAFSSVQELPVRYGTDDTGHPAYWFEKAVSWTEYEDALLVNGKKEIPVYFKTILAANATSIEVSNEYFTTGSVEVKNYTPAHFTNLTSVPEEGTDHKVGYKETFSYSIDKAINGEVTYKFNGIEPAASAGLTFKGTDGDGNRIYAKAVNAAAGSTISFDVYPYRTGNASITLSAMLFDDATLSEYVPSDDIRLIYINENGTGIGTRFTAITGNKVEDEHIIPGMAATMTIYIANESANGTVKVGGNTFTKRTSDTSVPGYTAYYGTYTAPSKNDNSAGFYDELIVTAGGNPLGSVNVPVYGIHQEAEATSTSFSSTACYLIKSSANRYMYNPGTNNATDILNNGSIQFSNLMKINGGEISTLSSSTTYYLDFNYSQSGLGWLADYTYNYAPRLDSSNSSNLSYHYQSGQGFTLSQVFDERKRSGNSANYVTRYMYDNNGTIAQNTTAAYWHIYPVTFVAPL